MKSLNVAFCFCLGTNSNGFEISQGSITGGQTRLYKCQIMGIGVAGFQNTKQIKVCGIIELFEP